MNSNLYVKANAIIKASTAAYFGVPDENGNPVVMTITPLLPQDMLVIYFSTALWTNKVSSIKNDKRSSLCFHAERDNITLVGESEIITDQAITNKFWDEKLRCIFPGGEMDEHYCIIKFITERVSLRIGGEKAAFTVEELLRVQSRCGLCCDWCEYKQSANCGGCIETNGNPFYGECSVAKCCQTKALAHCGECDNVPNDCGGSGDCGYDSCFTCAKTTCPQLSAYSFADKNHGDNPPGARIELTKAWKNSTKQ